MWVELGEQKEARGEARQRSERVSILLKDTIKMKIKMEAEKKIEMET